MPECWCCKSEEGHLLHVLWSSNKVQEFQARNYNNICEVLETQHLLSPSLFVVCLLAQYCWQGTNTKLVKEDRRCSLNSGRCCYGVARVAALGKKEMSYQQIGNRPLYWHYSLCRQCCWFPGIGIYGCMQGLYRFAQPYKGITFVWECALPEQKFEHSIRHYSVKN